MSEDSKPHSEHHATIREESALLADWAEEGGMTSVDVDVVRSRLMAAADSLEEQLEAHRRHAEHVRDAWLIVREGVDDAHLMAACEDLDHFLEAGAHNPASRSDDA